MTELSVKCASFAAHMKSIPSLAIAILMGCGFSFSAAAQTTKEAETPAPYTFSAAYEFLRSTHTNFFNGPSLKVTRNLKGRFKPGLGIGYATTALHPDNGYKLYRMKLLPVYANLSYDIYNKSKLEVFAEASAGVTFFNYFRATDEQPDVTTYIHEEGLYLYGGFGVRYAVSKHFSPFVGTGLKGYKMSFNNLDINPHGITFVAGVRF